MAVMVSRFSLGRGRRSIRLSGGGGGGGGRTPTRASPLLLTRRRVTRSALAAEANLFSRIGRIVRSYGNALVSSLEDPEKVLDQSVVDMQSDYAKMRQATAQVIASQKQLEVKYDNATKMGMEWKKRAQLALEKGNEDLARQALEKRKVFDDTAQGLQQQLALQKQSVDKLIEDTRLLESKITDAKTKKETLKARAAAAKTSQKVAGAVSNIDSSNALSAFEKMEEKVLQLEAEADAIGTLAEVDKLSSEFKMLEGDTDIDMELAAMKKELAGPKGPAGELPAGRSRSSDAALDKEIEDMKKEL